MEYLPNLLLVGGTGRNIGKTTFVERLVGKLNSELSLITLKTSMLLPGEEYLHGKHRFVKPGEFFLLKENTGEGNKDSNRYLKAGASQSWFLSVGENALPQAMEYFLDMVKEPELIIAESNVIREIIIPGVFIMIKGDGVVKPQAVHHLAIADVIVTANNRKAFEETIARLEIAAGGWQLM